MNENGNGTKSAKQDAPTPIGPRHVVDKIAAELDGHMVAIGALLERAKDLQGVIPMEHAGAIPEIHRGVPAQLGRVLRALQAAAGKPREVTPT